MDRRQFFLTPGLAAAQPIAAARPRLYFTTAGAARLRTRISREPAFRQSWTALLDSANRLLDAALVPESEALQGSGQHANYGRPSAQLSAMGLTLGLAWHVTADRRYAEKLRAALLHYSGYQRWNAPGRPDRNPQWKSELNGARFCYGAACGYDALHSLLSPADRKAVAAAIARLGVLPVLEDWVLPETRIHALDSMGHNWWAVCVSMAGVAALSLAGDDGRVPSWLDRIARGLALWFDFQGSVLHNKAANFDRAGAFYEGVGYANYALSEYLRFRLAWANVYPGRPQPRFRSLAQATDFFLHTLYPTTGSFFTLNFGDSGLRASAAGPVRLLEETGFTHPNAGWYLGRMRSVPSREVDPLALLASKTPSLAPPDRLPRSIVYRDIGWGVLRSSWKDDATLLAVRCGFTWNHVHADAGSFVLFHKGRPLITDSGACSYSHPLYGRYYVQSRAHNVVLFNGEGQPTEDIRRGVKNPGTLHSLIDGHGLQYVFADATGPMSHRFSRNFRHWLWTGGAILVFDDLRAHQEGRLDWLLHYDGEASAGENRVEIANGEAKAEVRFLFPARLVHREETGYADHRPERQVPYLVFSTASAVREEKFLAAIVPGGQSPVPEVEPLSAPLALGARIRHGMETTDVWFNLQADGRRMHDNSNHTIDGWETDAYLFAVTRRAGAAEPVRIFVAYGSYLRRSGRVLLDSLSKITAVWRPGQGSEVFLDGQPAIEASIAADSRPASLAVNGRATPFTYDPQSRLLSFRGRTP